MNIAYYTAFKGKTIQKCQFSKSEQAWKELLKNWQKGQYLLDLFTVCYSIGIGSVKCRNIGIGISAKFSFRSITI